MNNKLVLLFALVINILSNAQGNLAEDYSISKKANVSSNLNTGKVNISIPLYNIDLGNSIMLQSNLNYKQEVFSGEPSMTGTGWDSNLFGKIVVAHAFPDKLVPAFTYLSGTVPDGYNIPLESKGMPISYCMVKTDVYPSKYSILTNPNFSNTSYIPNTYYFDFFGYTGYMIYDNTGKFIVHCDQADLKAEFYGNKCYNLYQPISNFPQIIIKDDKGNKFYFGGDFNNSDIYYGNINYTRQWYNSNNGNSFTNNRTNYISSLYLTKAILANGRIIEGFYKQSNRSIIDQFVNGGAYGNENYSYNIPSNISLLNNNIFLGVDEAIELDGTTLNGSPNGSVLEMKTNVTIYQKIAVLDSIKVSDYGTINFSYSQLYNSFTKPFLSSINLVRSKKLINKVNFNYIKLNNSTFLQTLKNNEDEYNFSYYINFPNNNIATTGGLLKTLMYPTRGMDIFEYEQNKISKRFGYVNPDGTPTNGLVNINTTADGFRIKSIRSITGNVNYNKNYYYTDETFNESGIQTYLSFSQSSSSSDGSVSHTLASKGKFDDYIRYSMVTEEIVGKQKIKYYFSDLITNPDSIAMKSHTIYSNSPPNSIKIKKDNERGRLYKVEKFDKDNNLVYSQHIKYTNFLNNANPISEIYPTCNTCKITDDRYYIVSTANTDSYYQYQPVLPYLPISIKTREKIGDDFIETKKYFKYNTSYLY